MLPVVRLNSTALHQTGLRSPACTPFKYASHRGSFYEEVWKGKEVERPTRISFLHMRKAGGTSLYKYFKKVIESNLTSFSKFDHCEGVKVCLELNDNDGFHKYYPDESNGSIIDEKGRRRVVSEWDNSGSTFYVTHIREPVARALSHYKYTHRFLCQNGWNATTKDKIDPVSTGTSLEGFVRKANIPRSSTGKSEVPKRTRLWACSSNCYARWATGIFYPINATGMSLVEYENEYPNILNYYYSDGDIEKGMTKYGKILTEESVRLLFRYDLIIVLEWLQNDPEYAKMIEDVFFGGVRGINKTKNAHCANQMKHYSKSYPLEIPDDLLHSLHKTNAMDNMLYQSLTSCS